MTTITTDKLRDLVKRLHASSLEIQEANQLSDPSFALGWRGATNTYAIELMALIDREAAAQAQPHTIHVKLQNVASVEHVNSEQWPKCIDCGAPVSPERDPLRCLVCQLDKDAGAAEVAAAWEKANAESPRLSFTPTPLGLIIGRKDPQP
ncbi:MAG TPA: hypothetical protein VFN67_37430 [Polyangiales bacterium]|nr:hypothetical protein [Polyangiales bacterium]